MKPSSRFAYKEPGAKVKVTPKYIERKETHDQYISDNVTNAKTNMHTGNKKHHNSSTFNNSETTANSQLLRESTQKDTESKVTTFNTPNKGGFLDEKRISSPKTTDHSNLLQPKYHDLSNLVETKDHEIQQLEEQNVKIYNKILEVLDRVREKKDIELKINEKEHIINNMQHKLVKVGQEIELLKSYPKSRSIADIYNDQPLPLQTEVSPNFNRIKSVTHEAKEFISFDNRARKPISNLVISPKAAGRSPKTTKSPKMKQETSPPTIRNVQSPKSGLRKLLDINQGHPEYKFIFRPPGEVAKKEVSQNKENKEKKAKVNKSNIQLAKTVRRNYQDTKRVATEPVETEPIEDERPVIKPVSQEDLAEKFNVLLEKFSVILEEKQKESKDLKRKNKELEKKLKRICEINHFS